MTKMALRVIAATGFTAIMDKIVYGCADNNCLSIVHYQAHVEVTEIFFSGIDNVALRASARNPKVVAMIGLQVWAWWAPLLGQPILALA